MSARLHGSGAGPIANLPPELANNPQYEVQGELGRGGMGVVYLAKNKLMDRLEVLKVVNNGSFCWLDKDVRIIRARGTGGTGGDHYGPVRSDNSGDKIDFVWRHPSGASGTFTLRLSKRR